MRKPYKLGFVVGRFQTFHNGHADMIGKALGICEKVAVFIGSSQESGTEKNPFPYETRANFFKEIYGDAVSVYPLPDLGVGNNPTWGEYVIENVVERCGEFPDIMISGKEERRIGWLAGNTGSKGEKIAELYVPKTFVVSATEMRDHLLAGDYDAWKRNVPRELWDDFPSLREITLAARGNVESSSI